MLFTLVALTAALFLITSNALSIDTSAHHLARHHQHIAARFPPAAKVAKRASVSARCKKRNSSSTAVPSSTSVASVAAATTSTPASAPSPSQAPPSSGGSGKVGLAWAYGDDPSLANFITSKVSAFVVFFSLFSSFSLYFFLSSIYSWTPTGPQNTHGLQYAPMLWGTNQLGTFESTVKAGYANIVLGFNE
jgi:Glycosyl hydrolase catalytic core